MTSVVAGGFNGAENVCAVITCDKALGLVLLNCSDYPCGAGVLVCGLGEGSVAASAGLKPGSIVVAINDCAVHEASEAVTMVNKAKGQLRFSLATSPVKEVVFDKAFGTVGITLSNSSDRQGAELVIVDGLEEGGLAARSGVELGDAVIAVNGQRVLTHQAAIEQMDAASGIVRLHVVPLSARSLRVKRSAKAGLQRRLSFRRTKSYVASNRTAEAPVTKAAAQAKAAESPPKRRGLWDDDE
jgi:S1-C subfamily serine protease